jgi:hypothetical protein
VDVTVVRWRKRPAELDAVQITADNIRAVAAWCHGTVITDQHGAPTAIRIRTALPIARIGEQVIEHTWPDGTKSYHWMPDHLLRWGYEPVT